MIKQWIDANTFDSPGSTITLAALRRRYAAEHGAVNRSAFVAAVAAAGLTVAYHEAAKQAVVVGRSFVRPAVLAEQNGVLVLA